MRLLDVYKDDGAAGEFQRLRAMDVAHPDTMMLHVDNVDDTGASVAAGIYLDFESAAELRDWLDDWMVKNWPQEEDDETTAD